MKVKLKEHGRLRLYILPDSAESKDMALKLCKAYGYSFYPRTQKIKRNIANECYSGHLNKKEKLTQNSVCTVSEAIYKTLDLPLAELDIPEDDLVPISVYPKEISPSVKDSPLIFIAGRGIGSKENFERLKKLSNKFGACLGCTRPIAMNGWESYDNAVGISGNILASDTAVCFGVSGATPFIKGIENCKQIIAINNNKDALIFKNADYAIIDDCINVISYLESLSDEH